MKSTKKVDAIMGLTPFSFKNPIANGIAIRIKLAAPKTIPTAVDLMEEGKD